MHRWIQSTTKMSRIKAIRWPMCLVSALWCGLACANEPSTNSPGAESTANQRADGISSSPTTGQPAGLSSNAPQGLVTNSAAKKSVGVSSKPPLVIDKRTTFILKPLKPDGYPDYFAALNDDCRGSATVDNNAAVLLIKAFGPELVPPAIRDQYFGLLGMSELPSAGKYFVRSQEMMEALGKSHARARRRRTARLAAGSIHQRGNPTLVDRRISHGGRMAGNQRRSSTADRGGIAPNEFLRTHCIA